MKNSLRSILPTLGVLLSIVLLLGHSSCISQKGTEETVQNNAAIDLPLLYQCWKHAYEDNSQAGEQVYKPCDSQEFPPSRYRASFTIVENGSCTYSVLAPNDAHGMGDGTWTYDDETATLILRNESMAEVKRYEVVSLSESILIVKD